MADELAPDRHVFREHPLLGTVVEVVVVGGSRAGASSIAASVFTDIDRLEQVFSAYRRDSELNAWKRDEVEVASPDLCSLMTLALEWQHRSAGSFNPLTGALSALWSEAEQLGRRPASEELLEAAAQIRHPRYEIRGGVPVRTGDCTHLNFNAIAKGLIVDRALASADLPEHVASVLVSAGGDLAHRGVEAVSVGIENPLRPFDNEPPIFMLDVCQMGVATSGGAHRGFRIDGERFSHVIDPHTGQPVTSQASVTIVAPSALLADVLATVVGAMSPEQAVEHVEALPDAGCLVVDRSGAFSSDSRWSRLAKPTT